MKDMVAITIAIGEKWRKQAAMTAALAEHFTGLKVQILSEDALAKTRAPSAFDLKYFLFDLVQSDCILYFDADLAFVKKWSPQNFIDRKEFVCVREHWWRDNIRRDAATFGVPLDQYFNSGLFIINRENHHRLLEFALQCSSEANTAFPDQGPLNAARTRLGISPLFLNRRFNTIGAPLANMWDRVGAVGLHDAGIQAKQLPQLLTRMPELLDSPASAEDMPAVDLENQFFWFRADTGRPELVQLLPDGTVGAGNSKDRRLWFSIGAGDARRVAFASEFHITAILKDSGYLWAGHGLTKEGLRFVSLEPIGASQFVKVIDENLSSPKRALMASNNPGLDSKAVLERYPDLKLTILISATTRIAKDLHKEDIFSATDGYLARRTILDTSVGNFALDAIPERSLDFAVISAARPDFEKLRWLSKLRHGGLVIYEPLALSTGLRRSLEGYEFERRLIRGRFGRIKWFLIDSECEEIEVLQTTTTFTRPINNRQIAPSNAYPTGFQIVDYFPRAPQGRGVVICSFSDEDVLSIWTNVKIIRETGCKLPIEVWSLSRSDSNGVNKTIGEHLGVKWNNAMELQQHWPMRRLDHGGLRPFAFLCSEFNEIVSVDSGNFTIGDPSSLFEQPKYLEHGCLFWAAVEECQKAVNAAHLLNDCDVLDLSQIILNKERCRRAIVLASHLYERFDGTIESAEKDSSVFLAAWRAAGSVIAINRHQGRRDGESVYQFDSRGVPCFYRKEFPFSLKGYNPPSSAFVHERFCLSTIDELRDIYFRARDTHIVLQGRKEEFLAPGLYLYVREGYDAHDLELTDDGIIHSRAVLTERNWFLDRDWMGRLALNFAGESGLVSRMRLNHNNIWCGKYLVADRKGVQLHRKNDQSRALTD